MYRLIFCVHGGNEELCIQKLDKSNGTLSSNVPQQIAVAKFKTFEAFFNDLNDTNSFIYNCYNSIGLHFFIVEMTRVLS